jgi:hypothetical protein
MGASYMKNENSLFGNSAPTGEYGSECQVTIPTCHQEDYDEPYEFENVAEGPKNQINGLKISKR